MTNIIRIALPTALALLTACGQESRLGAVVNAPASETFAPNAMLAYEHTLDIELPAERISERLSAAREACVTAKFGECHILSIRQDQYGASISMRAPPAGIEPLIALASKTGKITSRNTRAEDLSEAVKDNRQKQARLEAYAKRMDEISRRADIKVADLMTLAQEQASVQQQYETLRQESAQQQRRIDTNLLSFSFSDANNKSVWRDFRQSLGNLLERLLSGIADALALLAYGLPFLIGFFPVLLLWRWMWRRVVRHKEKVAR
jgi:hypothetical protein